MQSRRQGSRKLGRPQSGNIAGSSSIQIHGSIRRRVHDRAIQASERAEHAHVLDRKLLGGAGLFVVRANEWMHTRTRGQPGKLKHHLSNYNRAIGLSFELFRIPLGSTVSKSHGSARRCFVYLYLYIRRERTWNGQVIDFCVLADLVFVRTGRNIAERSRKW